MMAEAEEKRNAAAAKAEDRANAQAAKAMMASRHSHAVKLCGGICERNFLRATAGEGDDNPTPTDEPTDTSVDEAAVPPPPPPPMEATLGVSGRGGNMPPAAPPRLFFPSGE